MAVGNLLLFLLFLFIISPTGARLNHTNEVNDVREADFPLLQEKETKPEKNASDFESFRRSDIHPEKETRVRKDNSLKKVGGTDYDTVEEKTNIIKERHEEIMNNVDSAYTEHGEQPSTTTDNKDGIKNETRITSKNNQKINFTPAIVISVEDANVNETDNRVSDDAITTYKSKNANIEELTSRTKLISIENNRDVKENGSDSGDYLLLNSVETSITEENAATRNDSNLKDVAVPGKFTTENYSAFNNSKASNSVEIVYKKTYDVSDNLPKTGNLVLTSSNGSLKNASLDAERSSVPASKVEVRVKHGKDSGVEYMMGDQPGRSRDYLTPKEKLEDDSKKWSKYFQQGWSFEENGNINKTQTVLEMEKQTPQLNGKFWLQSPNINIHNYYYAGASIPASPNDENKQNSAFYQSTGASNTFKAPPVVRDRKMEQLENNIKKKEMEMDEMESEMGTLRSELEHEMLRIWDYMKEARQKEGTTQREGSYKEVRGRKRTFVSPLLNKANRPLDGPLVWVCDVEDSQMCGFEHTTYRQVIMKACWTRRRGCTPVDNTGPCIDHTLGTAAGHYLYMSSSHCGEEEYSEIKSPVFVVRPDSEGHCMEFYFQMMGRDTDFLGVYIVPEGRNGRRKRWHIRERYENHLDQTWRYVRVGIPNVFPKYQIVLRGRAWGVEGDIAVDDIKIFEGLC